MRNIITESLISRRRVTNTYRHTQIIPTRQGMSRQQIVEYRKSLWIASTSRQMGRRYRHWWGIEMPVNVVSTHHAITSSVTASLISRMVRYRNTKQNTWSASAKWASQWPNTVIIIATDWLPNRELIGHNSYTQSPPSRRHHQEGVRPSSRHTSNDNAETWAWP